jgi:hypothetical protein
MERVWFPDNLCGLATKRLTVRGLPRSKHGELTVIGLWHRDCLVNVANSALQVGEG